MRRRFQPAASCRCGKLICHMTVMCKHLFYLFIGRISDCPKPHTSDEDLDVTEERERIYKNEKTGDILRMRDLSKVGADDCAIDSEHVQPC